MTAVGVVSGEGVRLDLVRAGVLSRTIATAIDVAIQAAALLALAAIDNVAAGGDDSAALRAVLIVEIVLVVAGYPIVLEWATRGRTVGKICLGLRVVRDDGGPIGLRHALVRGLASLVLEKPGLVFPLTTAAGLATMTFGRDDKRIGDLLAGTVVLDERAAPQQLAQPYPWVPYPLQSWAATVDLHRVDDTLALRIRQFVGRAYAMSPAAQDALGRRLGGAVHDVVTPPPPPGAPPADVLHAVLAERRRRASGGVAAPAVPLPPLPHDDTPPPTGPFAVPR